MKCVIHGYGSREFECPTCLHELDIVKLARRVNERMGWTTPLHERLREAMRINKGTMNPAMVTIALRASAEPSCADRPKGE